MAINKIILIETTSLATTNLYIIVYHDSLIFRRLLTLVDDEAGAGAM
jgi:hypothetical protein